MPQFYVGGSKAPGPFDHVEAIGVMAGLGLKAYEIAMPQYIKISDTKQQRIADDSKAFGSRVSLHGEFYTVMLSSAKPEHSEAAAVLKNFTRSLTYARDMNIPVVIHPGAAYWSDPVKQMQWASQRLQAVMKEVDIDPALVYLETLGKYNSFGDVPELLHMSRTLGTRICIDWSHLYARYSAEYGYFPKEIVQVLIKTLEGMDWAKESYHHISGITVNNGGEDKHVPFGESEMPWKMVLTLLKKSSLEGRIIVESGFEEATDARTVNKFFNK